MTVQLDWPTDVVDRLTEEARKKGLSLDTYVLEVVQKNGSNGVPVDDAEKLRKRREAAASIRELRKGNVLGPDLTIRDLVEEGRRF
jgi:hypothetical protein